MYKVIVIFIFLHRHMQGQGLTLQSWSTLWLQMLEPKCSQMWTQVTVVLQNDRESMKITSQCLPSLKASNKEDYIRYIFVWLSWCLWLSHCSINYAKAPPSMNWDNHVGNDSIQVSHTECHSFHFQVRNTGILLWNECSVCLYRYTWITCATSQAS